jgi:hypothetical protein
MADSQAQDKGAAEKIETLLSALQDMSFYFSRIDGLFY